ncbi:hypothetical protein [Chryseobacterium cucumeris]|uniref:hypothetical protein n=1 Tax=Chryseobacterium cucumeris TaxID=1813611 RepID=UPI0037BF9214
MNLEETTKQLENDLKKAQIEKEQASTKDIENKNLEALEKIKIEKVQTLRFLLQANTIDAEKNIPGCEPLYIPLFNETEQYTIKEKLFEVIKTL